MVKLKYARATRDSTLIADKSMLAKSKRSTHVLTSVSDKGVGLKSKRSTPVLTSFVDKSMLAKSKRSQAAMEFLMTYGWAILAAIIVIAVVAIYFRPGNLVQNQCILSAPFNCYAGVVSTNGITLEVKNGAGQSLKVQSVEVEGCGIYTPNPIIYPDGLLIADQSLTTFVIECILESGDKFQGDIEITYVKIGSGLALTSPGTIAGVVFGEDIGGPVCTDNDGDGYYIEASGCNGQPGFLGHGDCDDALPNGGTIYPGATELCDGWDNQCSGDVGYGIVDEGCALSQCSDGADNDGDSLIDMNDPGCSSPSDNDENNCGNLICDGTETLTSCPGDCPVVGTCGNAIVNVGEQCDDGRGNGVCPSTCSSTCEFNSCSLSNQIHFVTVSGAGTQSGADWNNAMGQSVLGSTLRGHTYYIADGVYNGFRMNALESGNTYTYIKKATNNNPVVTSAAGWVSTIGDGVADFTTVVDFDRGFYVFDGVVGGGPGDWDGSSTPFGFKRTTTGSSKGLRSNVNPTTNVSVRHVEIQGNYGAATSNDLFYMLSSQTSNWTYSHLYAHDSGRTIFLWRNVDDSLVQYSYIARSSLEPTQHSEGISSLEGANNTIRYNIWEDIDGTGQIMIGAGNGGTNPGSGDQWKIYGNVFSDKVFDFSDLGRGNGVLAQWTSERSKSHRVYNNIFYNLKGAHNGVNFDGVEVYNNIFYLLQDDIPPAPPLYNLIGTIYDNNVYYTGNAQIPPLALNDQMITPIPFVDANNYDFSLSDPASLNPGVQQSWMDSLDMYGNVRGSDGKWDRGAIEYVE